MAVFPVASKVPAPYSPEDGGAPRVCADIPAAATPWPSDATVRSVHDIFRLGLALGAERRCLGHRPFTTTYKKADYIWATYGEVATSVTAIARGMRVKAGARVGIFGANCPNWIRIQVAASAAGACLVTLYSSLGPGAIEYISTHADLTLIFVSEENLPAFLEVWPRLPLVSRVVVFGRCHLHELQNHNVLAGIRVPHTSSELLALGALANEGVRPDCPTLSYEPAPDDLFIIMYTSGTTGNPKGVMLRNRNFVSSVALGGAFNANAAVSFGKDDIFFSFLPLAHILAQQMEMVYLSTGMSIGYSTGDIKRLLSDLDALQPTLFAAVPRVYARFEQKILAKLEAAAPLRRALSATRTLRSYIT
eukprot:IDg13422t1